MKLLLIFVLIALTICVSHGFAAGMSDFDRDNWHQATKIYQSGYKKGQFASYRTSPESFSHVSDLQGKALLHAQSNGVIPIAKYDAASTSEPGAATSPTTYFSSVIKPEQELHKEMRLHNSMNAFTFWKHEGGQFHLLQVDTLSHCDNEWSLKPLEGVLAHH